MKQKLDGMINLDISSSSEINMRQSQRYNSGSLLE
jgi:hypothetical protein